MSEAASHRRRNPLTGDWVVVSPHRLERPWQGRHEGAPTAPALAHDPDCYLCPGNRRASGAVNPDYAGAWAFENDFPALLPEASPQAGSDDPLFQAQAVAGRCEVVCFSPDHSRTLPQLEPAQVREVIDLWAERSAALGAHYPCVQVFENKGALMGCSNPHPHSQIWATSFVPGELAREDAHQAQWLAREGRPMLEAVVERELADGSRVVVETPLWLAVVPYWASWPFETLLLPRFDVKRLTQLDARQRDELALVLGRLTARYDNLFGVSFPYSMGWHGAPFDAGEAAHWRLHAHFYPPLLRSATVRKFMVGFEMLAEPQRDLTPEQAAQRLRGQADVLA